MELVRLNPVTGALSSVGFVSEIQSLTQGEAALDASAGLYVFLGSDGTDRLYTIRMQTASVVSKPAVSDLAYLQVLP